MKNIGHYIQHRYQGRKGFGSLYASESAVFKRLQDISQKQRPAAPCEDLQSRIARLNLGPEGLALQQALEAFRAELQENSYRALKQLGQEHGQSKLLRQKAGMLNTQGEVSAPSHRRELSMKLSQLSQKLNFNSSGHDLLKELKPVLSHLGSREQNRTSELLGTLITNGMQLSHQKADVLLGQRRDAGERQALIKARLVLEAVTLVDLEKLLLKVEALRNRPACTLS